MLTRKESLIRAKNLDGIHASEDIIEMNLVFVK